MPFDKSVHLFLSQKTHRGPGVVAQNLITGLEKIGVKVEAVHETCTTEIANNIKTKKGLVGCLQPVSGMQFLPEHTLMGPNLFVLPSDWDANLLAKFKNFVVPSQWVLDKYLAFPSLHHAKISIWSAGVDTDRWASCANNLRSIGPVSPGSLKCLLYFKNRNPQDLGIAKKILGRYNIDYRILEYGHYKEEQLEEACSWANMGLLLTDTESQGLAYMQMLSTDLPLFVFNKPWWEASNKTLRVPSTSVPYFDSRCGEISDNVDLKLFEKFIDGVMNWKYSPREYVLQNHSLEASAKKYLSLLLSSSSSSSSSEESK